MADSHSGVPVISTCSASFQLHRCFPCPKQSTAIWVGLKIDQEELRRFWSMFPLTRVPFWYRLFEPQPSLLPRASESRR